MTTPTDIDRTAAVVAHHEIDIHAPLEGVWDLHINVDQWQTWNAEVTAARLDGAFVPGTPFTWTSYDFTVTSTIYEVQHRARTLWGGAARRASWACTNGSSNGPPRARTSGRPNPSPGTRSRPTQSDCKASWTTR